MQLPHELGRNLINRGGKNERKEVWAKNQIHVVSRIRLLIGGQKMNWDKLIKRNVKAVKGFATGQVSGRDFYNHYFRGKPNEARQLIRERRVDESRSLARKALKRRGLIK